MADRRPTVYDVAERAEVSIATVSFTYRRPDKVKPATRAKVLAAAKDLGYMPSGSAKSLAHGRTGAIGLFSFDYYLDLDLRGAQRRRRSSSDGVDPTDALVRSFPLYVDEIQRGVELECWARGYALLLNGGQGTDSAAVVSDIAGRVDGLAVFPRTVPHELLLQIARRIPVVELGDVAHGDQLGHVTVDNFTATRSLAEHLLSAHGLRELQFVRDAASWDNTERFAGFRAAVSAAGLPAPEEPLSPQQVPELIGRGAVPQGLLCSNDLTALHVIDVLSAAGVEVPQQVAVTGFDGILAGRLSRPTLSTIRQPMEEMGRAAVDVLIKQMTTPDNAPEQLQMPASVVLRESCGCAS
jgi:DNA-binding LacI/PurR family transcriptional regulator